MTGQERKALVRFGRALRAQRKMKRYKQKDLAALVGINARTQANIEWARHWPSLPVYFKLCEVLEMPQPPFLQ